MIAGSQNVDWDRNAVREQYQNDKNTRAFLDYMATYVKNPSKTEVDAIQANPGMTRKAAIDVLRGLADKGCGKFWVGRHEYRSRIEWSVSPIKVAQDARAAIGEPAPATETTASAQVEYIEHEYRVRRSAVATVRVPADLTPDEAAKLAEHVRNAWFS